MWQLSLLDESVFTPEMLDNEFSQNSLTRLGFVVPIFMFNHLLAALFGSWLGGLKQDIMGAHTLMPSHDLHLLIAASQPARATRSGHIYLTSLMSMNLITEKSRYAMHCCMFLSLILG
jgi:hypothetical protein